LCNYPTAKIAFAFSMMSRRATMPCSPTKFT
jgi:hypothetical protein